MGGPWEVEFLVYARYVKAGQGFTTPEQHLTEMINTHHHVMAATERSLKIQAGHATPGSQAQAAHPCANCANKHFS